LTVNYAQCIESTLSVTLTSTWRHAAENPWSSVWIACC